VKLVDHIVRIFSLVLCELDRLIDEPARLVTITLLSQLHKADFPYLPRPSGLSKGNLFATRQEWRCVDISKSTKVRVNLRFLAAVQVGRIALWLNISWRPYLAVVDQTLPTTGRIRRQG
jgi:hypothetical protein